MKSTIATIAGTCVIGATVAIAAIAGVGPVERPLRFMAIVSGVSTVTMTMIAVNHRRQEAKKAKAAGAGKGSKERGGKVEAIVRGILWAAMGVLGFGASGVLIGAPVNVGTVGWSVLMASLTAVPFGVAVGRHEAGWVLKEGSGRASRCRWAVCVPAMGAIVGAWLGAIPIPLDWDRAWQAWPIPCAVGAICGQMLGSIASAVLGPIFAAKVKPARPVPREKAS